MSDVTLDQARRLAITYDGIAPVCADVLRDLAAQVKRLTAEREAILQQAKSWACEADTQTATVRAVGRALGGVPCWGPIAAGVEAALSELTALRAENGALRAFYGEEPMRPAKEKP